MLSPSLQCVSLYKILKSTVRKNYKCPIVLISIFYLIVLYWRLICLVIFRTLFVVYKTYSFLSLQWKIGYTFCTGGSLFVIEIKALVTSILITFSFSKKCNSWAILLRQLDSCHRLEPIISKFSRILIGCCPWQPSITDLCLCNSVLSPFLNVNG